MVAGGVYPSFWRGPWSGLPGCAPEQIIVAAKSLFTCCASACAFRFDVGPPFVGHYPAACSTEELLTDGQVRAPAGLSI